MNPDRNPIYWKAAIFYYNPADPRVIVTKRLGIGWTLNFARPVSWAVMALILAVPVAGFVAERVHSAP